MSKINDGGPAFPRDHAHDGHNGMPLRDYFAANAMLMKFGATGTTLSVEQMAKRCYEMADSMLEARDKGIS